ncbi:hypothetical protein [Piscibacillus salipiscarius]|uniref:hypothetical protein n=1 Tax=Piscibacillus salipiscarius TaxID=299480 RepID=UPI0006D0181B|nr:hypothetical protein [Piscibacillus salipiscarius]
MDMNVIRFYRINLAANLTGACLTKPTADRSINKNLGWPFFALLVFDFELRIRIFKTIKNSF